MLFRRHKGELGVGKQKTEGKKKAPQELDPVHSFITFEEKGGKAHSFVSE